MIGEYVCRFCGSVDVCTDERVPRSLGIDVTRNPDGTLTYEHTGESVNFDEAAWEGSETIGFICGSCAASADELRDLVILATSWRRRHATGFHPTVRA